MQEMEERVEGANLSLSRLGISFSAGDPVHASDLWASASGNRYVWYNFFL